MKYETIAILFATLGLTSAFPMILEDRSVSKITTAVPSRVLRGREVPQEHSHEQFLTTVRASLNLNNPDKIVDPVFGLLGDAAAAAGQGSISNTDCLQQATADQAFTNAKSAGDVAGMTAALIYRALERNTGGVGVASVSCSAIKATNAEIAAISQHQDPASPGAAANNKAVTLELAKQIASVGGDPQDALKAGTFAPGSKSDDTGKGNSCDTTDDPIGCIFTQNLLVQDATADEITAAAAGVAANDVASTSTSTMMTTTAASSNAAGITTASECSVQAGTTVSTATAAISSATTPSVGTTASETNVQTFTGALGGILAPAVIFTNGAARPFSTDGSTFVNSGAALQRSCSVQHNQCSDAANSGTLAGGQSQCETQEAACNAAIASSSSSSSSSSCSVNKRSTALDFGSCSDPAIEFAAGLDGRTENAFIAVNQVDFNHGSALNIGVIASFICQRLGSPCNASADTLAACAAAEAAAAGQTGQAAADAFNSALGVESGATATAAASGASETQSATAAAVAASCTA